MMEEAHSRKRHNHTVFIRGLDNDIVADRSAGFGDIGNTRALSAFDVVAEGEERIRTERNARDGI